MIFRKERKRMKKLWIIVVAVMVSAFALTGCGGSADAKSVESA